MPERFGFPKINPSRTSFPDLGDPGWSGRVAKEPFGAKSKRSKTITKVISDGQVAYQQKLEDMKNSIGVKIDSNVTSDIHRNFRLEGSLNSKSRLVKLVCQDIEKFNPYIEACLIEDKPVEILANFPIKFSLKNT